MALMYPHDQALVCCAGCQAAFQKHLNLNVSTGVLTENHSSMMDPWPGRGGDVISGYCLHMCCVAGTLAALFLETSRHSSGHSSLKTALSAPGLLMAHRMITAS